MCSVCCPAYGPQSHALPCIADSSSSECDDASEDDDQSFESCEQHKNSSANSPQLHPADPQAPSPSTVASATLSRLSIGSQSHDPSAAPEVDSSEYQDASESPSLAAAPSLPAPHADIADVQSASVTSTTSRSTLCSEHELRAPADAEDSTAAARAADAVSVTEDGDHGQIFDCFDLKIVYERGRTGFEDTKEIDFTPGMLIAVRARLHCLYVSLL